MYSYREIKRRCSRAERDRFFAGLARSFYVRCVPSPQRMLPRLRMFVRVPHNLFLGETCRGERCVEWRFRSIMSLVDVESVDRELERPPSKIITAVVRLGKIEVRR